MRIYSFRSSFDEAGENTHKHVFPVPIEKWAKTLRDALNAEEVFGVEWSPDDAEEGTLIGGLMSGFIGKREVFRLLERFMTPNRGMASLVGIEGDYVAVSPVNFMQLPTEFRTIPHMFMNIPQRDGCLVTERFREVWERHGFTGATFREVAQLDDRLFLMVGE